MSYAGTVLDMIKRQKMNRGLQKKKRSQRQDQLTNTDYVSGLQFNPDFGKDLSPEMIQQSKEQIRRESRRVNQRIILVLLLCVVFGVFLVLFWF